MLDIVYPSHSESEAGMGSFTISSKQLPNSRWCDWWERVGLECTLIWRAQKCTLGPYTGLCMRPQAAESVGRAAATPAPSSQEVRDPLRVWEYCSLAQSGGQVACTALWSRHGSRLCHSLCDFGHITSGCTPLICKIRGVDRVVDH